MSKAILVIDMPDSCSECPCFGDHYADMCCRAAKKRGINYPYSQDFRQEWCPLMLAPEPQLIWHDDERDDWQRGYNNCLREIVGEEDE